MYAGYMVASTTIKDLQGVLMEPKLASVKEPYFTIQGNNGENITILASGKNGIEFNKTFGDFHTFPGVEIYHCLYGQGLLIMQRNGPDGEPKEVKVVGLRSGTIIEVPAGYGHCIVNTGKNFLIVADNAPANPKMHSDELLKTKKGLAYYVIDKKGNIAFEENPNYHFHPQISTY